MSTLNVSMAEVRTECATAAKVAEELLQTTTAMVRRFSAAPIQGSRKADQVRDEMQKVQSASQQCSQAYNELTTAMRELVDELDRVAN
jgi:hypothetical protein